MQAGVLAYVTISRQTVAGASLHIPTWMLQIDVSRLNADPVIGVSCVE